MNLWITIAAFAVVQAIAVVFFGFVVNEFKGSSVALLFAATTFVIMVVALAFVKYKELTKLNYLKSLGILLLIYIPSPVLGRLYWILVRGNFGTVDWSENLIGMLVFYVLGIGMALVVAIFFRRKTQQNGNVPLEINPDDL